MEQVLELWLLLHLSMDIHCLSTVLEVQREKHTSATPFLSVGGNPLSLVSSLPGW